MQKWTKGPWYFNAESGSITDDNARHICRPILGGWDHEENTANARLISAAPRMYDALSALAKFCNGKLGRNPYGVPEYKEALQAIAEARGFTGDWMDAND